MKSQSKAPQYERFGETIRYLPPVRRLVASLPADLETICAKALHKEPDHRYQAASELAEDIRHFLRDEHINARAATMLYQIRKFARRHRGPVAAASAALLAIIAAAVVSFAYSPRGGAVLFSNPREMLEGALYRQGESFLVRGLSWYRLDPQTWTVTELGRWPSEIPKLTGFTWAGVSHHHGVILWNSQGRYYRVLGGRTADEVAAALTARSTELRKRLATRPKDWDAWRELVWRLYDGHRAEEARQACLDWIAQFSTRAELRFALADIERNASRALPRGNRRRMQMARFRVSPSGS